MTNWQNSNEPSKTTDACLEYAKAKIEWLRSIPDRQFSGKHVLMLVGAIIVIFAWKSVAVGKVESDMAKKLQSERMDITLQAREYADQQYSREEERFGQVLSWAVRGELIRNNIDQIEQYFGEVVRMKDTQRVDLVDSEGQLLVSTDKRFQESKANDVYPKEFLNLQKITLNSDVNNNKILVIPVMGLNKKIGTVIVSYKLPKF
ncbi:MAG: hypothetical protein WAU15_08090 [Nitrosomonas sp.]